MWHLFQLGSPVNVYHIYMHMYMYIHTYAGGQDIINLQITAIITWILWILFITDEHFITGGSLGLFLLFAVLSCFEYTIYYKRVDQHVLPSRYRETIVTMA